MPKKNVHRSTRAYKHKAKRERQIKEALRKEQHVNNQPRPTRPNLTREQVADLAFLVCPQCGHRHFEQAFCYKRLPALLVGAPVDQVVPFEVMLCKTCGAELDLAAAMAVAADAAGEEKPSPEASIISMDSSRA